MICIHTDYTRYSHAVTCYCLCANMRYQLFVKLSQFHLIQVISNTLFNFLTQPTSSRLGTTESSSANPHPSPGGNGDGASDAGSEGQSSVGAGIGAGVAAVVVLLGVGVLVVSLVIVWRMRRKQSKEKPQHEDNGELRSLDNAVYSSEWE